ncbi:hypothetical protein ABK040_010881 [Willaertia magna]
MKRLSPTLIKPFYKSTTITNYIKQSTQVLVINNHQQRFKSEGGNSQSSEHGPETPNFIEADVSNDSIDHIIEYDLKQKRLGRETITLNVNKSKYDLQQDIKKAHRLERKELKHAQRHEGDSSIFADSS